MRDISNTNRTENQKTQVMFSNVFENRVVYEIIWKNILQPERLKMSKRRVECWIRWGTNTYWRCVMLIVFPLQLARTHLNITLYLHCRLVSLNYAYDLNYKTITQICTVVIHIHIIQWSSVLSETLTGHRLVKTFPALYVSRKFTTAITNARHPSLSRAISIQSIPPHSTSGRSIIIQSSYTYIYASVFQVVSFLQLCQ
jgi:hypothetical protein